MLYIGSDHGGYKLKEHLKKALKEKIGIKVVDVGAKKYVETDDYPDFAKAVAEKISKNPEKDLGILLCKSGQGVCIAANKFKNVRAALVWNIVEAKKSRTDDLVNIICLPAEFVSPEQAEKIVEKWLDTPWSTEERHWRRVKKISSFEK
jgi:ribose 5-phosphate isomerase B